MSAVSLSVQLTEAIVCLSMRLPESIETMDCDCTFQLHTELAIAVHAELTRDADTALCLSMQLTEAIEALDSNHACNEYWHGKTDIVLHLSMQLTEAVRCLSVQLTEAICVCLWH